MSYSKKNLRSVTDAAPQFGMGDKGVEARFARTELDASNTGLTYLTLEPGIRQPFGHRHQDAEEIYVVLTGTGRVKLDDEIVELEVMDAVRVAPGVTRQFEAGPDGLEYLALGAHHDKDGEMVNDWWTD